MDFKIPQFSTDKELFDFLVKHEDDIFYSRKQAIKYADGFTGLTVNSSNTLYNKSGVEINQNKDYIDVVSVINTTKLLDSHSDVHIDGLWDKSLSENKRLKHLQEHKMAFDKIIADKDDLKAYVKTFSWKELGYNVKGNTQALVFESRIHKERNPYMFEQYSKGNVDNHSVGMRYVKMVTCINDDDYPTQKENYEKYAPMIANSDELEHVKYFWAVTEAKAIEGSAVPMGSNMITPTISTKQEIEEIEKINPYKNWLGLK